jgi:hypothetical protein
MPSVLGNTRIILETDRGDQFAIRISKQPAKSSGAMSNVPSVEAKVLREREALALVGGADAGAVQAVGPRDQALVDQTADPLPVLEHERHLEQRAPRGTAGLRQK